MLYSGADLIRTSGQQAERIDRIKAVEPVQAVATPQETQSNLDGDTQGALLRFARFIHDENKKAKSPKPPPQKELQMGIPHGYLMQVQALNNTQGPGAMLDVYG